MADVYALTSERIDEVVTITLPGVYLLDKSTTGAFAVNYVGRADDDIAKRLKQHATDGYYKFFQFEYQTSAKAAFDRECELYHYYPNLDNIIHPARPKNTYYSCPVVGCRALG
jgi:hypothetical protein